MDTFYDQTTSQENLGATSKSLFGNKNLAFLEGREYKKKHPLEKGNDSGSKVSLQRIGYFTLQMSTRKKVLYLEGVSFASISGLVLTNYFVWFTTFSWTWNHQVHVNK